MKKWVLFIQLFAIVYTCLLTACSGDDEEDNVKNITVTIRDDGSTSNGSIFSAIDDKNFYIDYVKYSVVEGHLEVSGWDSKGFNGVANIVSKVNYHGNYYEVLEIGSHAFYDCYNLTKIIIPNSVRRIGRDAFRKCSNLTTITIPNGVTYIEESAFSSCENLTYVTIPNTVIKIAWDVFYNCTSLTSITIPTSVTWIGCWAFENCTSLTSVECKSTTPPDICNTAFPNVKYSNATLYVPKGSANAYQAAEGWSNFNRIIEK